MHPKRRTGVVHIEELHGLEDEMLALMRRFEAECLPLMERSRRANETGHVPPPC